MVNEEEPSMVIAKPVSDAATPNLTAATVEENDDDAEAAAVEMAREKAAARKKRILEKANKRMKYVNGEQVQDELDEKTSISNAARIRAARQRRYGKKTASTVTTTSKATTTIENASSDATDTEQVKPTKEEPREDASDVEPSKCSAKREGSNDDDVDVEKIEKNAGSSKDDATAPVTAEKKKKYLGVAKIRRQMLAKKKLENTEGKNDNERDGTTGTIKSTGSGKTIEGIPAVSQGKMGVQLRKVQSIPIYMHLVIISLLFLVGFDVGIQQFHSDVHVSTQVSIQEYGVPFFHRSPWQSLNAGKSNYKGILEDELQQQTDGTRKLSLDTHDEFQEIDEEEYVPNIDPLFGVDLDEMTKESGILNKLAKGAISIHRSLLWLLYYFPMGILASIISIPSALIQTPPFLFIYAILLRQVLGKAILGAAIPEVTGNGDNDGKNKNNIEVLSLAKNFIKSFVVNKFPTLVTLYDAYVHLKSDMYIILCGVFFGLAWTHLNNTCDALLPPIVSGEGGASGSTDEL